jgi:hypothetical protein
MKFIYDLETYRNFFLCVLTFQESRSYGAFECSARRNDASGLAAFVKSHAGHIMVGFNNLRFDYPILHWLIGAVESGEAAALGGPGIAARCHQMAQEIITASERDAFTVWPRHQIAPQMDLMRIHHMDNRARATSLKALQCAMRSPSVQDLPIPPDAELTSADMDEITRYCIHDVAETERFLELSIDQVEFRETLGPDFYASSDASIGKKLLKKELEKIRPGCTSLQTWREHVDLKDIIFPYVSFRRRSFAEMLDRFQQTRVQALEVKSSFPKTKVYEAGLVFNFGLGGLHGSKQNRVYCADDEYEIEDVDVISFYPSLAIVNDMAPEHLKGIFSPVYNGLFLKRQSFAKGTPNNAALKLALNAVFGDSGSTFSSFYDVAFMLQTTVNGQLLLCMLVELLAEIPGLEIIQANTDGLTLRYPRLQRNQVEAAKQWWQDFTKLKLESVSYNRMWIRDVNNYLVERVDGKVKRKGAYEYKYQWWQDPSATVIARAAEACLIHGARPLDAVHEQLAADPWSFLLRVRARGRDRYELGGFPLQKTVRYYLSTTGLPLEKIMPPLAGKTQPRRSSVSKGKLVRLANDFDGRLTDPDIMSYAFEVQKLINGIVR